uniref:Carboxypeptidase Q n=1 Tax=Hirondellea gigas TaxID=1518452 RepID=A0A2P2HWS9_9CRUS
MLYRMYTEGIYIEVHLVMEAENLPMGTSRNVIIDHEGTINPDYYVVLAGHIDSWDVGQGVMDDAGGCFVSYHASLVLNRMGLKARRTVRNIWFTGEEFGIYGGNDYYRRHKEDAIKYQLMLESDLGTFDPMGIGFTGSQKATCIMELIVGLTAAINTTELVVANEGEDVNMWSGVGVPTGSLYSDTTKYFWFHHTAGDTLEVEEPDTLDRITALLAAVAYVTADISVNLALV